MINPEIVAANRFYDYTIVHIYIYIYIYVYIYSFQSAITDSACNKGAFHCKLSQPMTVIKIRERMIDF